MIERLGLDKTILRKTLQTALSTGGDFAEIYIERRYSSLINLEEDIIKETAESVSLGLSVRVLSGEKTGFAFTSDLSPDKIFKVARTAAFIARSSKRQKLQRLKRVRTLPEIYQVKIHSHDSTLKNKIALAQQAYDAAKNYDSKITKVKALFQDSFQEVFIMNTEGLEADDERPMVRLICSALAEKSGQRESGFWGGGGRVGLEYFKSALTPKQIGQEAAKEALILLEASDPPAGEMPVVLAPGHSGVLIHEAVGHLLEADFVRKKTSIFWNKMGKKVGRELLTIYDDPTIPGFRGSYAVDDEGAVPKKTLLIEKGMVKGFLFDRLSAKLMKRPLSGHGRRDGYSSHPIPRMSNTYIENGNDHPEEIVKSVSKGFYVQSLQGGQVEDSGKFTFSVSLGYLIEKGKLTRPVKQATLIGTNLDILNKVEMVGSDLSFSLQTGSCGKEGQSVPVSDGCPTVKIAAMTVGGQA